MKQIVGILFLLFALRFSTSGQSRVLKGTITSQLNTSTTILPNIVVTKTPEVQKEDSAIFNPRYVPPPPIESSNLGTSSNINLDFNSQNNRHNSQFSIDANKGGTSLTPTLSLGRNKQPTETVYQYKTPDAKPIIDNGEIETNTPPPSFHYNPKGGGTKKGVLKNNNEYGSSNSLVTDPIDLAASNNYGNNTTVSKWHPNKVKVGTAWKKTPTSNGGKVLKNNSVNPPLKKQVPNINNTVNNVQQNIGLANNTANSLTPAIHVNNQPTKSPNNNNLINPSVNTNNSSIQVQVQTNTSEVRPEYKVNLGTDGKFTVTFFNNGGSVVITQFGRIASVSMPTNGGNIIPKYNYRGLLESVGNLPIQYTYEGRVQSVGSTTLGYNYNGNVQSIGSMQLAYNYNGTIDKIGNSRVNYDANGNVNGTNGTNPLIAIKQ